MQILRQYQPDGTHVPHPEIALDCETASLLRGFLLPVFETATNWADLRRRLVSKGYDIAFRDGHMVLLNLETSRPCAPAQCSVRRCAVLRHGWAAPR